MKAHLHVSSYRFDRTDVETVVHSDSGFATVSYLRINKVTLEEKPEQGYDLSIPPLLETSFTRIQAMLRGQDSTDTSVPAVPGSVCRSTGQFCGPSRSRRGDWVAVGDIYCAGSHTMSFKEEVTQCFRELEGSPHIYRKNSVLIGYSPTQQL
jgi:diphthine-ammonia ligase